MRTIEVRNKKHETSEVLGRIGAIPVHAARFELTSINKDVPPEMAEYMQQIYKKVDWNDTLEVNFNHSPLFHQLRRVFSKDRRTNAFVRWTIGWELTVFNALFSKVFRRDYYNPFSHSVQIFSDKKAYTAKNVAMGLEYDQSTYPTLRALGGLGGVLNVVGASALSPTAIRDTWRATKRARQHMPVGDTEELGRLKPDMMIDLFGGKTVLLPLVLIVAGAQYGAKELKKRGYFRSKRSRADLVPTT